MTGWPSKVDNRSPSHLTTGDDHRVCSFSRVFKVVKVQSGKLLAVAEQSFSSLVLARVRCFPPCTSKAGVKAMLPSGPLEKLAATQSVFLAGLHAASVADVRSL